MNILQRVRKLVPKKLPSEACYSDRITHDVYKFPLGIGTDNEISWDIRYSPHLLIFGQVCSGKSVLQRNLILHAMEYRQSWDIVVLDPRYSFSNESIVKFPNPDSGINIKVSSGENEIMETLRSISDSIHPRKTSIQQDDRAYDTDTIEIIKSTLLIIDEANFILELGEEARELVFEILRFGRSVGINIALSALSLQSDNINEEAFEGIIQNSVICGEISENDSMAITGAKTPYKGTESLMGRSVYYSSGTAKEFQMFYAPSDLDVELTTL